MTRLKRFICLLLAVLFLLCSCGKPSLTSKNKTTTTTAIAIPSKSNDAEEVYMTDYLSHVLMYKIANDYAVACSWEFGEKDVVPYEEIFGYFLSAGCHTFDERMINPSIFPYYDEETFSYSIPHEIVDEFLTQRFNTIADPKAITYYNHHNGHYEFEAFTGTIDETIEVDFTAKRRLRENVFEFKARYVDYFSDDPIQCSTFVVELTASGHKILSHNRTKEEPSEAEKAVRKVYEPLREDDSFD